MTDQATAYVQETGEQEGVGQVRPVALVPLANQPLAMTKPMDFNREQVALIKDQIAPDCTDGELDLFIEVCKARRLNPFIRQIYAIKRTQKKKVWKTFDNGGRAQVEEDVEVMTIQTGIGGFRAIADRTNRYEGQEGTWWCGKDGVWREVWLEETPPKAAKVSVLKRGFSAPMSAVALWSEYSASNAMWKKMPANQLAKCAEALALRKAFPDDLSGIYTEDEMAHVDHTLIEDTRVSAGSDQGSRRAEAPSVAAEMTAAQRDRLNKLNDALPKELRVRGPVRTALIERGFEFAEAELLRRLQTAGIDPESGEKVVAEQPSENSGEPQQGSSDTNAATQGQML